MSVKGDMLPATAAICVITGIPGSGKTLRALPLVENLRKATGRPVYYYAIPGIAEAGVLNEWHELAPFDKEKDIHGLRDWGQRLHEIETGAIIVVDEAQRTLPRRGANSPVPDYIQPFDMCRHRGHTWVLLTQDSRDLDPFVRRRIGFHEHIFRVFGMERATVWRWQTEGDPKSTASGKLAEKIEFGYPKEVYGWYKSSDQHTVQKAIPWKKLMAIPAFLILGVLLASFAFHKLFADSKPVEHHDVNAKPVPRPLTEKEQTLLAVNRPKREAPAWAAAQTERVPGAPASPSFYDTAWKAVTIPKISGFMVIAREGKETCVALTQQGTRLTTLTNDQCLFYYRNGWFDPTKPDQGDAADRRDPGGENTPGLAAVASTGR